MNKLQIPSPFIIGVTFLVAMILMLIPLPEWVQPWRPEWLAVTLIYWNLTLPKNVGIVTAWILGLCVDVIHGTLLGQHALGFAVTAYLTTRYHMQVQRYPLHQQSVFVGIVLLPYMGISFWVLGILGEGYETWLYWAPIPASMLVWPGVYWTLRMFQRKH